MMGDEFVLAAREERTVAHAKLAAVPERDGEHEAGWIGQRLGLLGGALKLVDVGQVAPYVLCSSGVKREQLTRLIVLHAHILTIMST